MNPPLINDERQGLPSASGADKLYNCPGSVAAESECPAQAATEIANQGTIIHLALETSQREGLELDEITIVERLEAIKKAAVEEWHIANGLDPKNTQVGREERYFAHHPDGRKIASAKLDTFFINGVWAICVDYKSGFLHATPAARNAQLKVQALCLWENYENLEHIRVAIAQCRFKAHYDPCDYELMDLRHAKEELLLADWRSKQPDAPRFSGTWCAYCKAKQAGTCREAIAYAMLTPVVVSLPSAPAGLTKVEALDRVNKMTVAQLAFVNERGALTRSILDAVTGRLKSCTPEELASVGLVLGKPGRMRKVRDFQKLFEVLFNAELVTLEEFKQWVDVTLGAMESVCIKRLSAKNGITQKAAKELLATMTEPAITFNPSEPRLNTI